MENTSAPSHNGVPVADSSKHNFSHLRGRFSHFTDFFFIPVQSFCIFPISWEIREYFLQTNFMKCFEKISYVYIFQEKKFVKFYIVYMCVERERDTIIKIYTINIKLKLYIYYYIFK